VTTSSGGRKRKIKSLSEKGRKGSSNEENKGKREKVEIPRGGGKERNTPMTAFSREGERNICRKGGEGEKNNKPNLLAVAPRGKGEGRRKVSLN